MRNPSSMLHGFGRRLRRPSPAMLVASVALFMSLGGASYAAVSLGKNSVRTANIHGWAVTNAKIANNAVNFNKIKPGSVGVVRIVKNQVQLRLKNTCSTGQAMTAVDVNGKVTCAPAMSGAINSAPTSAVAVDSATSAATMASLSLPSGSAYAVQANPYITVTPSKVSSAAAQHVVVTCTLSAGTGTAAEAQRSASVDLPAFGDSPQVETASIPLVVDVASNAAAIASDVSCVTSVTATSGAGSGNAATNPATVTAQGQIYATQLASVTTGTTATTTTTGTTTTTTPQP